MHCRPRFRIPESERAHSPAHPDYFHCAPRRRSLRRQQQRRVEIENAPAARSDSHRAAITLHGTAGNNHFHESAL